MVLIKIVLARIDFGERGAIFVEFRITLCLFIGYEP